MQKLALSPFLRCHRAGTSFLFVPKGFDNLFFLGVFSCYELEFRLLGGAR